jgi:hypothetical protein
MPCCAVASRAIAPRSGGVLGFRRLWGAIEPTPPTIADHGRGRPPPCVNCHPYQRLSSQAAGARGLNRRRAGLALGRADHRVEQAGEALVERVAAQRDDAARAVLPGPSEPGLPEHAEVV